MNKLQPMRLLTDVPVGSEAMIAAVHGDSSVSRRLMEMGVVPGVSVRIVKTAPFGDPIQIMIRGYSLALRRNEADAVEVQA